MGGIHYNHSRKFNTRRRRFAFGDAERKTRQIFDSVEYDRQVRKVKSTVEDYLTAEINIANNALY